MSVDLYSDRSPPAVTISLSGFADVKQLEVHIRTLQTARRWLIAETKRRNNQPPRENA